jgi:hypothetical protein
MVNITNRLYSLMLILVNWHLTKTPAKSTMVLEDSQSTAFTSRTTFRRGSCVERQSEGWHYYL